MQRAKPDNQAEAAERPELTPDQLPPLSRTARLAVFGGSFDPVHAAHMYVAGEILRRNLADEVMFVPARLPPHKQGRNLSPAAHRIEMLRLAASLCPAFSVSDIELLQDTEPSYTIRTLETLEAAFPDRKILFVAGMDSLRDLHTWHRAIEIVANFGMIIFPRPGVQTPPYAVLVASFGARHARRLLDSIIDGPGVPISATDVREAVATGQSVAGLVPESVQVYIAAHGLFARKATDAKPNAADRKRPDDPN